MDDMLSITIFVLVVIVVLAAGVYVLRPEKKIGSRSALVLHGGVAHCSPEGAKVDTFLIHWRIERLLARTISPTFHRCPLWANSGHRA
jgi:hypothetical protein